MIASLSQHVVSEFNFLTHALNSHAVKHKINKKISRENKKI